MKTLYLLRHAQAAPAIAGSDKDRTLSTHGHAQAKALGSVMAKKGYAPDVVLCSSAVRTRQTLEGLAQSFGDLKTEFKDEMYYGGKGEYFSLIQGISDSHERALLVGHNPTMFEMAIMMSADTDKLSMSYAPGTLSILQCNIECWADIQPEQNMLMDVLNPS